VVAEEERGLPCRRPGGYGLESRLISTGDRDVGDWSNNCKEPIVGNRKPTEHTEVGKWPRWLVDHTHCRS
jgi:hypothetical protein